MRKKVKVSTAKQCVFLISASFIFFAPGLLHGDTFIKKIKHTEPVALLNHSQPSKDEEGGTWIAKNKFRADEGEKTTIIRLDLKKVYIIDHKTKIYTESDLPVELEKILSPEGQKMTRELVASAVVTDSGLTGKVKNWTCRKYLIETAASLMDITMTITQELWVSENTGLNGEQHKQFQKEILALNPLTRLNREKIQEIEGYPLLLKTTMKSMGTESRITEEVVSIEKKKALPGTYDLPQGYTKSDYYPFDFLIERRMSSLSSSLAPEAANSMRSSEE